MSNTSLEQCRSWLFVPGHISERLDEALATSAEAIVVDLEEFTPAHARPLACKVFATFAKRCRQKGRQPMARINSLTKGGNEELDWLMVGEPTAIFLPQVEDEAQLQALEHALATAEAKSGLARGATSILPTLESRRGVERAGELLQTSSRISAALIGTGDLALELGLAPSQREAGLRPFRERFLSTCRRAGVLAIDGPWHLPTGFNDDQAWAIEQGFRARCVVDPQQIAPLHRALAATVPESHDGSLTSSTRSTP